MNNTELEGDVFIDSAMYIIYYVTCARAYIGTFTIRARTRIHIRATVIGNTGSCLDYIYNLHTWGHILTKLSYRMYVKTNARASVYVCITCVCAGCRRILVYWSRVVDHPPFPFSTPPYPPYSVSSRPAPPCSSPHLSLRLVPPTLRPCTPILLSLRYTHRRISPRVSLGIIPENLAFFSSDFQSLRSHTE